MQTSPQARDVEDQPPAHDKGGRNDLVNIPPLELQEEFTVLKQGNNLLCMALSCVQLFHALGGLGKRFIQGLQNKLDATSHGDRTTSEEVLDYINQEVFEAEGFRSCISLDTDNTVKEFAFEILVRLIRALTSPWKDSVINNLASDEYKNMELHHYIRFYISPQKHAYHVHMSNCLIPSEYRYTLDRNNEDEKKIKARVTPKDVTDHIVKHNTTIRKNGPKVTYDSEAKGEHGIDVIEKLAEQALILSNTRMELLGGIMTCLEANKALNDKSMGHEIAFVWDAKKGEASTMDTHLGKVQSFTQWMEEQDYVPTRMELLLHTNSNLQASTQRFQTMMMAAAPATNDDGGDTSGGAGGSSGGHGRLDPIPSGEGSVSVPFFYGFAESPKSPIEGDDDPLAEQ